MSSLLRARQLARRCEPRRCQGYRRAEIGVVGPNIDDVPARDLDRLSIAMEEIADCKRDLLCDPISRSCIVCTIDRNVTFQFA